MTAGPTRARFENTGGWAWAAVKLSVVLALWGGAIVGWAAVGRYGELLVAVEAPREIALPMADAPSRVVSARGFVVGGLERGGGEWVEFEALSPAFIRALVASEDARFFEHDGVDVRGTVRAVAANLRAGRTTQGGSTLTQQLAKSFVGDERVLGRKLRELAVARRIEATTPKTRILAAYANRAYFGAGATGVDAAARLYFGTTPRELTEAQAALLVALLPAPGRFNPFVHPERAAVRRDRVLRRMRDGGFIGREAFQRAVASPLGLTRTRALRVEAPEVERAAWRELAMLAPDVDWRAGGRTVTTGIDIVRQRHVQAAARAHVVRLDQRQGFRGPVAVVRAGGMTGAAPSEAVAAAWADALDGAPAGDTPPSMQLALVTGADAHTVRVWTPSGEEAVGVGGWAWAVPWSSDARNHGETIATPVGTFEPGQVVLLHARSGIVQPPRVEVAVASMDLASGVVEALAGAFDARRSAFDRATQGCRQPGSTFKPIVFSAALDAGFTFASLLRDSPMRVELGPFEEWRPRNADGGFEGPITFWEAARWSRNLPTLELYRAVGAHALIRRARALGVATQLDPVESLPLGASCVRPLDLLTVYASFAVAGEGAVARVVVRADGEVYVAPPNPWVRGLAAVDGAAAWWRHAAGPPRPRIRPSNAFQMAWILREVVMSGTASTLATLPIEVAGKTGTTNAYDAWFAGFSPRDAQVAWIGAEHNDRPLGRRESGGELALPLWADALLAGEGADGPVLGPAPSDVEWVAIEPTSGLRAPPDRWSVEMPFDPGRAPMDVAPTTTRVRASEIDRRGHGF